MYLIAGIVGSFFFATHLLNSRSDITFVSPSLFTIFLSLLVFYAAVEIAKLFWVPMKALSDHEVARKKSTYNKISIAVVIVFFALVLLGKYGF